MTSLSLFTHALEKEMETHSTVLAWRIPGMEEPGGLPSVGSHRVGNSFPQTLFPPHTRTYECLVAQSCLTLRNPMDCSLPGSSVHGIFQARALEWGAIAFSYYSSLKNSFHKICLPLTSLRAHPWQMAVSSGAFFFSKSK